MRTRAAFAAHAIVDRCLETVARRRAPAQAPLRWSKLFGLCPRCGFAVQASSRVTTFLFTDIEQSSRLWEEVPDRMGPALAQHDALARSVVLRHHGVLVKTTGDGMHAAFDDPHDALRATLDFQQALEMQNPLDGLRLAARCGLHAGVVEQRD